MLDARALLTPDAPGNNRLDTLEDIVSTELASRDEQGRLSLSLRGRPERLAVSRLFAPQFKAM